MSAENHERIFSTAHQQLVSSSSKLEPLIIGVNFAKIEMSAENHERIFSTAHQQLVSSLSKLNSGYDNDFVTPLDGKYECTICLTAMRSPMQTSCGHRFCYNCIMSWLSDSNKECPIDKKPLSESDLFHDSCIEREILLLKVKCPNKSLGCKFQTDLKYIEDHMHACVYQPVMCPNECSITVLQKELDEHLALKCLNRLVKCKYCESPITFHQQQLHLIECPHAIMSCDLCNINMSRKKMAEHRKDDCLNMDISCPFSEHGCQFQTTRSHMKIHTNKAVEYHVQLLSAAYKKINTLVLDMHRNIGLVATGSFSRQPSFKSQLSTSSFQDNSFCGGPNERLSEQTLLVAAGGHSTTPHFVDTSNEKTEWNIEEESKYCQNSEIKSFGPIDENDENCTTKDDHKQLKTTWLPTSIKQEKILKDLSGKSVDIDQRVVENSIKIDNLIARINSLDNLIQVVSNEMQVFANEMSKRFCNGVLVWKIPNFTFIYNTLKDEKRILHSQPFYSSQFGYKFCLRTNILKFNDGYYLTLYIHMMQSDNDDFLNWPYKGKICLQILDCGSNSEKRHFSEDFEVSDKMEAFMRPKSFRSIKGYGFKEFISVDKLLNPCAGCLYLKDDSVYIKAVVSTGSSSSTGS